MRGYFFYEHQLSRKQKLLLAVCLLSVGLIALALTATFHMRPILTSMASARVTNVVNQVTNTAVNETIDSGEIDYSDLISFEKDNEGKVTAVRSNMAEFNRLQSHILDRILTKISQVDTRELSIPVGSLTGAALLSGRGPRIHVRMESVGSSSASLQNAFTSEGINQTKHQIILNVDVYVSILLPGFVTATKVSNSYTVAETVIVGAVPESYTYFHSTDPMEDTARDRIMNIG